MATVLAYWLGNAKGQLRTRQKNQQSSVLSLGSNAETAYAQPRPTVRGGRDSYPMTSSLNVLVSSGRIITGAPIQVMNSCSLLVYKPPRASCCDRGLGVMLI